MIIEGWKYYNHAAVPTVAPHEMVNFSAIQSGEIWNIEGGKPVLARWISDFDCGYETEWWYVIKDDCTTLEQCKKKVRKEIRKANDKLNIKVINPEEYEDETKFVYHLAVSGYEKPDVPLYLKEIRKSDNEEWIGAFDRVDKKLIAYKVARLQGEYVEMVTSKVNPNYRSYCPLLAMNFYQIEKYINSGLYRYMSNGARTILHQTGYNDYLENKLGFRKAYCRLNIVYRPIVKPIVSILFPFRAVLKRFDNTALIRRINGILEMEYVNRSFDRHK